MQTTSLKLYSLEYGKIGTYWIAALFILGNVALPQLCHLMPMGGVRWLPIYFFTLVGAYKYGWRLGVITALVSPLVNSFIFDMPHVSALPAIMLKSTLLAGIAGYTASKFRKASLLLLAVVVLAYQLLGSFGEWLMGDSVYAAIQDFRIGLPGMAVQVFGGWIVINCLLRR
ncbi:MAG: ECF transporter S component [Duncaniella sp.]|nr:ECF transporter S component [Duncaniella sp.]